MRGNPALGIKVWIIGLISRETNTMILYLVEKQDSATLIAIIQRHVPQGSCIFSNSWPVYGQLNDLGNNHFSICHKRNFKAQYKNEVTGEIIDVCTNRIEGAWQHAKKHFKNINGTSLQNFKAHLVEIIWRNHVTDKNIYECFYSLLTSVYTLDQLHTFTYPTPTLFPSWTGINAENVR